MSKKIKPDAIPVTVSYLPNRKAFLVLEGPQQSEVKFADTGQTLVVCNEFVIRAKVKVRPVLKDPESH